MNYYNNFYRQNEIDGGMEDSQTVQTEEAMPDTGNVEDVIADSWGPVSPDFSGGGIEPPITPVPPIGPVLPDYSGGGIEPPIGPVSPDYSGGGIEPPIRPIPNIPPNTAAYAFRNCMNNLIYVYTRNGENFWYYPTGMDVGKVSGYRWGTKSGWFPYDIPYNQILGAYCYVS